LRQRTFIIATLILSVLIGPNVLRRFWLLFAQVATICLAVLFVVTTLRPDLLVRYTGRSNVVLMQETPVAVAAVKIDSLADAAKRAMPSVVNVYTSKEVRQRRPLIQSFVASSRAWANRKRGTQTVSDRGSSSAAKVMC
jgi:S1-C subfamily serine protease